MVNHKPYMSGGAQMSNTTHPWLNWIKININGNRVDSSGTTLRPYQAPQAPNKHLFYLFEQQNGLITGLTNGIIDSFTSFNNCMMQPRRYVMNCQNIYIIPKC